MFRSCRSRGGCDVSGHTTIVHDVCQHNQSEKQAQTIDEKKIFLVPAMNFLYIYAHRYKKICLFSLDDYARTRHGDASWRIYVAQIICRCLIRCLSRVVLCSAQEFCVCAFRGSNIN